MAKPRVFVSSTFYDLKHIRASLESFIDSLGFEAILSEKGHIAYGHEAPLDESCYKEVHSADIFVMIVGGRYGSERSSTRGSNRETKSFHALYDSVTKQEFQTALRKDIPIYIFVEKYVYADYETFLRNPDNPSINYPHVDSINTLRLIDDILKLPRNNAICQFERYGEIEDWLKGQWAGRFRDLLKTKSDRSQLISLQAQVDALAAINQTLQSYLEKIITKLVPENSAEIIETENRQLKEARLTAALKAGKDLAHMIDGHKLNPEDAIKIISEADSLEMARSWLDSKLTRSCGVGTRASVDELNTVRAILGLPLFVETEADVEKARSRQRNQRQIFSARRRLSGVEKELGEHRLEIGKAEETIKRVAKELSSLTESEEDLKRREALLAEGSDAKAFIDDSVIKLKRLMREVAKIKADIEELIKAP